MASYVILFSILFVSVISANGVDIPRTRLALNTNNGAGLFQVWYNSLTKEAQPSERFCTKYALLFFQPAIFCIIGVVLNFS